MIKIFLIDDDQTMRDLLSALLRFEGYCVIAIDDKENIFDQVRKEMPDVILLDVYIGHNNGTEINGLRILAKIRHDPLLQDVKVIMSSGVDLREKCLDIGADDFIMKPYMPEELIAKLGAVSI